MKLIGLTQCFCILLILTLSKNVESVQEDDIVFDDVIEGTPVLSDAEQQQQEQFEQKKEKNVKKWRPVEKLLGMPDAVATEGHVFKLKIHKQAFSGSVDYYEVSLSNCNF